MSGESLRSLRQLLQGEWSPVGPALAGNAAVLATQLQVCQVSLRSLRARTCYLAFFCAQTKPLNA